MAKLPHALWPGRPASLSLLSLAPELRINIYQDLLPPNVEQSDYTGLFRSCRLIRQEFKYEALKSLTPAYQSLRNALHRMSVLILSDPLEVLETSTLELQIPSDYLSYRRHLPKELAPFDWLFLSKVIITVYDNEGNYRGCSSLGFKYISIALEVLIQSQTIDIVKGYEQLKKTLGIQQVELGMLNVCHIKSINFDRPYSGVESRLVPPTSHSRRWTFNTQVLRDVSGKCVTLTWRRQNDWDMKVSFLRAQCYQSIKIFLQCLTLTVRWLIYGLILLGYLLFISCHVYIALRFLGYSVRNYQIENGSNVCLET